MRREEKRKCIARTTTSSFSMAKTGQLIGDRIFVALENIADAFAIDSNVSEAVLNGGCGAIASIGFGDLCSASDAEGSQRVGLELHDMCVCVL
jgi:hypothetical protein